MKKLLILISVTGLILTILPSVLVVAGYMDRASQEQWMLWGMLIWFGTAPFWIKEQEL